RVIPVLLRACDWTIAAFEGLAPLPPNQVPVSSWPNRDEAWTAVAQGIREAIAGPAGQTAPAEGPRAAGQGSAAAAVTSVVQVGDRGTNIVQVGGGAASNIVQVGGGGASTVIQAVTAGALLVLVVLGVLVVGSNQGWFNRSDPPKKE